jgi:hypothetical protein
MKQPDALLLAEKLEQQFPLGTAQHYLDGEAAAELRRLHAENKRLETLCYDYLGELTALRAAEQMRKQTFMAEYKFRTYGYYQDADGKMQVGEIPEEMLTVSAERTAQMIEEVTRTEPERKPLTEDEIELLSVKHAPPIDPAFAQHDDFIEFARAIERAHGIGGEA